MAIDFSKFLNNNETKSSKGLDFSKFIVVKEKEAKREDDPRFRTIDIPESMGGGQYRGTGDLTYEELKPLITSREELSSEEKNRRRGGTFDETQEEVDHIVSLFAGGTNAESNTQNLKTDKTFLQAVYDAVTGHKRTLNEKVDVNEDGKTSWWEKIKAGFSSNKRQEGKYLIEREAAEKFKNGEIGLGAARLAVINWEKPDVADVFLGNKKDFGDKSPKINQEKFDAQREELMSDVNRNQEFAKKALRVFLPKSWEQKIGITETPQLKGELVGEIPKTKTTEFATGPRIQPRIVPEGTPTYTLEEELKGIPQNPMRQMATDVRLSTEMFKLSNDKPLYAKALTKNVVAKGMTSVQGWKGASVVEKPFGESFMESTEKDLAKLRETDPLSADLIENIGFSLAAQGPALVAAAGTQVATRSTAAAIAASSATAGLMAYRMASYDIMQNFLEMTNEDKIAETGAGLTLEEENQLKEEFNDIAQKYGLWEAIPEMVTGGFGYSTLLKPLTAGFGKATATKLLGRLGTFYGEEVVSESITQLGQQETLKDIPELGGRDIDWTSKTDWMEALADVAPQTILLTTILGGSTSLVQKIETARKELKDTKQLEPLIKKIEEIHNEDPHALPVSGEVVDKTTGQVTGKIDFSKFVDKPAEVKEPVVGEVALLEEEKKYKSAEEATSIDKEKLVAPGTIEDAQEMKEAVKTKENAEILKESYLDQLIQAQKDIKDEGGRQTASTNALLREGDAKTALKTLGQIEGELPTKAQLTDIWNKATTDMLSEPPVKTINELGITRVEEKPTIKRVSREQLPVKTQGKVKVSKLEARVKNKLGKLTEEEIDNLGLSTYQELNKKENIKAAVDYVANNEAEAMDVLLGKTTAPKGLLKNSIYIAMTENAKESNNKELALKLASLEATRFGQEISILSEIGEFNPVEDVNKLIKIWEKNFKRRTGKTTSEARSSEKKKIKEGIKASKSDWNAFINEITC